MSIEAMKQALEALEEINKLSVGENAICLPAEIDTAMDALRQAIEQAQQAQPQADGLPLVIAGAIYDFAGYLTTRDNLIKVGSTANASPIADLVVEWAKLRGLSLADAAVLSWQELLYTSQPVASSDTSPERVDETAKQRHEQAEKQEPVVNYCRECLTYNGHQEGCSHYTSPPKRAPLTDEEIDNAVWHLGFGQLSPREVARAIEAAHGIKGEA